MLQVWNGHLYIRYIKSTSKITTAEWYTIKKYSRDGHFQNCHLYTRKGAAPWKPKESDIKLLQTKAFATSKVPLTVFKVEKTKIENFNFFSFIHNLKTTGCIWIFYIINNCSTLNMFLFQFRAVCELWLVSYRPEHTSWSLSNTPFVCTFMHNSNNTCNGKSCLDKKQCG